MFIFTSKIFHTSAIVILAALHMGALKFLADFLNIKLPALSAFQALMSAKSPVIDSSRIYVVPLNTLDFKIKIKSKQTLFKIIAYCRTTSLVSLGNSTDLSFGSYLIGWPPSWISVLTPVGVKNAGIPAPPALTFSARVPLEKVSKKLVKNIIIYNN